MGFFHKKTTSSVEYLELKKEISNLKIELESVKLTFDLVKKKLRQKAKLEESDEENPNTTSIFLDPYGKPLRS